MMTRSAYPILEDCTPLVGFMALAAVIVQTWDLVISLSDEVEFLWRGRVTLVKTLYYAARYPLLIAQVVNHILSFRLQNGLLQPSSICPTVYIFRLMVAQCAVTLLEAILLIRVYALYNKGFKTKFLLVSVFLICFTLETTGCVYIVRAAVGGGGCSQPSKAGIGLIGSGACLLQVVVFVMTIIKFVGGRRAGWARTPLTSLMLQEGVVAFLFIIFAMVVAVGLGLFHYNQIGAAHAIFSWFLAFLSITASRLILNLRKLALEHRPQLRTQSVPAHDSRGNTSVCLTTVEEFF